MNTPTRRRFRFSLRTLMIVVALTAGLTAYYTSGPKRQGRAAATLVEHCLQVGFDFQRQGGDLEGWRYSPQAPPPGPAWGRRMFGVEFFQTPQFVACRGRSLAQFDLAPIDDLPNLREVLLMNCQLGDSHMPHLGKLSHVRLLFLDQNLITDVGLAQLSGLDAVDTISLAGNPVTGCGFAQLRHLPRLRQLFLRDCPISDEGLAAISQLKTVENVALRTDTMTNAGLMHLAEMECLLSVSIVSNKVTEAGANQLREQRPKLKVLTRIAN